ncbi:hypothetical protein FA13DRAFT_1734381 [Coprinellus micaceus]|nr:hypothetical protein FA13DRAFT_1734381 [Coprinellus micaceus]
MRKVDYLGSEPVASKLLFAPPTPGSEDDLDSDLSSIEMASDPSPISPRRGSGDTSEMREATKTGSRV